MKLGAQVSLDLPNASDEQRKKFYEKLVEEKWKKVDSISTTWKMTFVDSVSPESALNIIKQDLEAASRISRATYTASICVGFEPVKVSNQPQRNLNA